MKRSGIGYLFFYVIAVICYVIAVSMIVSGENRNLGIPFLCFGSAFLCLGVVIANRPGRVNNVQPGTEAKHNGAKKSKNKKKKKRK